MKKFVYYAPALNTIIKIGLGKPDETFNIWRVMSWQPLLGEAQVTAQIAESNLIPALRIFNSLEEAKSDIAQRISQRRNELIEEIKTVDKQMYAVKDLVE